MDMLCFRLPGHSDAALKNMNSLREQLHFCDVTITAGGRQMFRGHKVVLAAGSAFLRDQFILNPSSELQVSVLHNSTVIHELLQSCYTGILQFSAKEIVNYLTAASYLQMEHVVEKCRGALGHYLQPKGQSALSSVKTEESQAMPVIVNGSTLESMSSPAEHTALLQPQSSEDKQLVSGLEPPGVPHIAQVGDTEDDVRNNYNMYEMRLHDDQHASGIKEDGRPDEPGREEDGSMAGGGPRGGMRMWKWRYREPRAGRGRGFKHRKRGTFRERRPLGFQQAWRFPTSEEILGNLTSVDVVPDYQQEFPVGLGEGRAEDSVDVVGSTSCVTVACEQCGLAFSTAEDLATHVRSAHLPYVCPCCGKHFSQANNLARHMVVHRAGAKVHACPVCHKTFTQKTTLIDHMNMHSGERPHVCAFCRVCFAHKPALRRHLKEQHGKTTAQNYLEIQSESAALLLTNATV